MKKLTTILLLASIMLSSCAPAIVGAYAGTTLAKSRKEERERVYKGKIEKDMTFMWSPLSNKDPYKTGNTITVVDKKGGYIQYKVLNTGKTYSREEKEFRMLITPLPKE